MTPKPSSWPSAWLRCCWNRTPSAIAVGRCPSTLSICIPTFARLVETALREVDRGVVEATQAMVSNTWQIIRHTLLPEARGGLLAAVTVTAIVLVDYTAMAGVIGGGGLGDLAIRYGYQRFQTDVMVVTVVLLLVLLHEAGLIKLKDPGNTLATQREIIENPKHLKIRELEGTLLARSVSRVDLAFEVRQFILTRYKGQIAPGF